MTMHSRLPDWLRQLTPQPREVAVIDHDGDRFTVTVGGETTTFGDVLSAYYFADRNPGGERFTEAALSQIRYNDGDVEEYVDGYHMISVSLNDVRNTYTQLMSTDDEFYLTAMVGEFDLFAEIAERFRENKDVSSAWDFIDGHPALWLRSDEDWTTAWTTSGYAAQLYAFPDRTDDGVKIVIEGGEHCLEDNGFLRPATVHYHNEELTMVADTWAEAIIQFAVKLDELFDETGTPR